MNAGGVSSEVTVSADSPIGPVYVSNSSESQSLQQVDGIDIGKPRGLPGFICERVLDNISVYPDARCAIRGRFFSRETQLVQLSFRFVQCYVCPDRSAFSVPLGMCGHSEIVDRVDDGADGVVNVGDEVTLAYTVTNTGNTCLGSVVVDDPSPGTLACSADFSGMRGGEKK